MRTQKQIFIIQNILLGISGLGSYVLCLSLDPEESDNLWGGITNEFANIFIMSMFISTIGYLSFLYVITFKLKLFESGISNIVISKLIYSCGIFLGSAVTWMPLTITYLKTDQVLWWIFTIISLWIVALALSNMVRLLISIRVENYLTSFKKFAVIGLSYITFHCLVFDAILWVLLFHS